MYLFSHDVKLTMTGLDRVQELADQIHKKSTELAELVYEFERLRLEMGIDIVRTPEEVVTGPEKSEDQM